MSCVISNGSLNVVMLLEMYLQANIDPNQVHDVANDILGEGVLGKFLVDNESVTLQGTFKWQNRLLKTII